MQFIRTLLAQGFSPVLSYSFAPWKESGIIEKNVRAEIYRRNNIRLLLPLDVNIFLRLSSRRLCYWYESLSVRRKTDSALWGRSNNDANERNHASYPDFHASKFSSVWIVFQDSNEQYFRHQQRQKVAFPYTTFCRWSAFDFRSSHKTNWSESIRAKDFGHGKFSLLLSAGLHVWLSMVKYM